MFETPRSPEAEQGPQYMLPSNKLEFEQWTLEWEQMRFDIPKGKKATLTLPENTIVIVLDSSLSFEYLSQLHEQGVTSRYIPVRFTQETTLKFTAIDHERFSPERLIIGIRHGSHTDDPTDTSMQIFRALRKVTPFERIVAFFRWLQEKRRESNVERIDIDF